MSKASKKRQKLTQEELKAENKKLRNEIAQGYINKEDSERIVQMLSTQNLIAYAFVGCVILYQYIRHFVLGG